MQTDAATGLRVIWIAHGEICGLHADPGMLRNHWSAGRRLRVGIPAVWLCSAGVSQWLVSPPSEEGLDQALCLKPDVVVVSGLYPNVDGRRNARSYFHCADAFRRIGVPVVVDLADNLFQDSRAEEFQEMIELSNGLVVNTRALADVIAEKTGRDSVVIGDPVEGTRREPAFDPPLLRGAIARLGAWRNPSRPLRLLWFGGQGRNYQYLKNVSRELQKFARRMPVELSLVAGPIAGIEADIAGWNSRSLRFQARFVYWSQEALERELHACDAVIIPSDVATRMAASTNRIAESIWAGRFVVASGLPSYWEFREAAWIGENMIEGLRWALQHRDEAAVRIARGQAIIAEQYAPEVIGRRWHEALALFAGRQP